VVAANGDIGVGREAVRAGSVLYLELCAEGAHRAWPRCAGCEVVGDAGGIDWAGPEESLELFRVIAAVIMRRGKVVGREDTGPAHKLQAEPLVLGLPAELGAGWEAFWGKRRRGESEASIFV
jgi:hypothetical protein